MTFRGSLPIVATATVSLVLFAAAANGWMLRAQEPVKKAALLNPAAFAERAPDTTEG